MKRILYLVFSLIICFQVKAQQYFTISGYVKDKNTGEVLIGVSIYDKSTYKGTVSNAYGFYSLSLPSGKYTLTASFVGYESVSFEIDLVKNISNDFFLDNSTVTIEGVTITAESGIKPMEQNEFCVEKISMKSVRQVPAMFGEADVVKAIQQLSGVKTLGDGSSAMFIRGGSSDQNLILIDEAPIYNPSHLFGLVSVFNSDAINHVDLYKSNMPAQYGGRVSSVIDCKMKEGNMYKYDFSAGLSPFSTTVSVNGPIVKEKSSFFVSGRKSIIDLVFKPGGALALVPAFYDVNLKVNTKIGDKDRLFLSFYNGKDRMQSAEGFFNKWGNTSGTLRWNRSLGSKLFMNTSLIISDYQNYLEFKDDERNYKWLTGLRDMNLKLDLVYYIRPGNVIRVGAGTIYHKFIPGESVDSMQSLSRLQAFEHAIYILNDIELFDWLGLNYGVRLSAFQNHGKATWFDYNEQHQPVNINTNQKGVYKTYINPEPRVSVNIKFSPNYSLKLAYAHNAQYMQVLQNNALSYTSLETWFPANTNIKPIIVDAVSVGWFQSLTEKYSFSVELYYKKYKNQIDYIDHARLVNNPYIEGEIRSGIANIYGVELNFEKEIGRFTGAMNYTYGRVLRKIDGINNGEEYSSPYDIPHDFRIRLSYQISKSWAFNSAWMYMSGRPVTLPVGFYMYQEQAVPIYTDRNASRFPDYHRLDISFNYEPAKKNRKVNWTMNFGVFNLYAKKNPLGYSFDLDYSTGKIKVYQYTLFTILPNFSIKVKF